jgi:SpoVK/Ycf46/Vps4 family AAA+-type ATPase
MKEEEEGLKEFANIESISKTLARDYNKAKEKNAAGQYWDSLVLARQVCYAAQLLSLFNIDGVMQTPPVDGLRKGEWLGQMKDNMQRLDSAISGKLVRQIEALSRSTGDSVMEQTVAGETEEDLKAACDALVRFERGTEECSLWFDNIAGLESAKQMMQVGFIQPILYPNLFGKLAKGVLLYGLPGTGKTLLVKAAVNELSRANPCVQVLFFAPSTASMKSKYVGETESKIMGMYRGASALARKASAAGAAAGKITIAVMFIDEIDGLAAEGRGGQGSMASIAATSVNTLLQVIDGFGTLKNVITVGATNFPWKLDSAILRRFTYSIPVPLPTVKEIMELLDIEFNKYLSQESKMTYERMMDSYGKGKKPVAETKCGEGGVPCDKEVRKSWRNFPIVRRVTKNKKNFEFLASMATRLQKEHYSSSDISRMFGIAVKKMGEQATRDNRFVLMADYTSEDAASLFGRDSAGEVKRFFSETELDDRRFRVKKDVVYSRVPMICAFSPFDEIVGATVSKMKTDTERELNTPSSIDISRTKYVRSDLIKSMYVPMPASRIANIYATEKQGDSIGLIFDYVVTMEQMIEGGKPMAQQPRSQVLKDGGVRYTSIAQYLKGRDLAKFTVENPPYPGDEIDLHVLFVLDKVKTGGGGGLLSWIFYQETTENIQKKLQQQSGVASAGAEDQRSMFSKIWQNLHIWGNAGRFAGAKILVGTGVTDWYEVSSRTEITEGLFGKFSTNYDILSDFAVVSMIKKYFTVDDPIKFSGKVELNFAGDGTPPIVLGASSFCEITLRKNTEYSLVSVDQSAFESAMDQVKSTISPKELQDFITYSTTGMPPSESSTK